MKLVITVEMDNAAFEEGGTDEVRRILENVSLRLPDPLRPVELRLHDINGNPCGTATIA